MTTVTYIDAYTNFDGRPNYQRLFELVTTGFHPTDPESCEACEALRALFPQRFAKGCPHCAGEASGARRLAAITARIYGDPDVLRNLPDLLDPDAHDEISEELRS